SADNVKPLAMTSARAACIDSRYWARAFLVSAASDPGALAALPCGASAAKTLGGARNAAPISTAVRNFCMVFPLLVALRERTRFAGAHNVNLNVAYLWRARNGKSRNKGMKVMPRQGDRATHSSPLRAGFARPVRDEAIGKVGGNRPRPTGSDCT